MTAINGEKLRTLRQLREQRFFALMFWWFSPVKNSRLAADFCRNSEKIFEPSKAFVQAPVDSKGVIGTCKTLKILSFRRKT